MIESEQAMEDQGPEAFDIREHERLWMEEIERRCSEIDKGLAEPIPGEEAFRRIRASL